MRKACRGFSTIEVMIAMLGMSIIILSTSGAKIAMAKTTRDIIARERASLFAVEAFEQLEAMKLTSEKLSPQRSWKNFLGSRAAGEYELVVGENLLGVSLLPSSSPQVKTYEEGDFYTELKRDIVVESRGQEGKLVSVTVSWGLGPLQKISLQRIFLPE